VAWCLAGLAAVPAQAREASGPSPLALIPAQAAVVVQFHGMERVQDRVRTLVKNVAPDLAHLLDFQVNKALKQILNGRQLKGLAPDGPVLLVLADLPKRGTDAQALLLVLARVTNYAEFRDALLFEGERSSLKKNPAGFETVTVSGQPLHFLEREGYAAITPGEELARRLTRKEGGLDSRLSKELAAKLLEPDLGVYVDLAEFEKRYSGQIRAVRDLVKIFVEQSVRGEGPETKPVLELYTKGADNLFQVLADSNDFLLSITVPPEGVHLHAHLTVRDGTASSKVLQEAKPGPLPELASLPIGFTYYTAFDQYLLHQRALQPIVTGFVADPDTPEGRVFRQMVEQFMAAGPRAAYFGTTPGQEGFQVWHFADPEKAQTVWLKLYQNLKADSRFQFVPLKSQPIVEPGAVTYRSTPFHHVRVRYDIEKFIGATSVGSEEMLKAVKVLTGEVHDLWFGVVGKEFIQIHAPDWKTAQSYLERYLEGKATLGQAQRKELAQARDRLPAETTMNGVMDVNQFVKYTAFQVGLIFQTHKTPPDKGFRGSKPSSGFSGWSLQLQPGRAEIDAWLPAASIPAVREEIQPRGKKP
jgi:hypothetical protein